MARQAKRSFWQRCRTYFRRFRIAVWLLILALLGAAIYLNQIGLPDFLKKPLLAKLRARGVDLEFSRLRLRGYRGLVAENVRFGRGGPGGPELTLREVEVRVNHRALVKLQLQVDSLVLRQGRLAWPLLETNRPPRALTVTNIQATLRFLPRGEWALDNFRAGFAGARIILSGDVANASAVREWSFLHAGPPAAEDRAQQRLRQFADALERIHFSATPELRLAVSGDARDLHSFSVRLALDAPDAETPWGKIARGKLTARLLPVTNNEALRAELSLQAADAQTPWAGANDLDLALQLASVAGQTNLVAADLNLTAARVETRWGGATNVALVAHWVHALTNAIPISGRGDARLASAGTRWGHAKDIQLLCNLATPDSPLPPADVSWAWWTNLPPCQFDWQCRLTQFQSEQLDVEKLFCAGNWRAPELAVTNLQASLYGGALDAQAHLDVATRAVDFKLASDFDVQKTSPLLTEKARQWLAKFSWASPPKLTGSGSLILPEWTNSQPDWRGEVQPTLCLAGEFAITNGAYFGVHADWARSHVTYSNMIWQLPDLEVARPEGRLALAHVANDRTKDYYWRVRGVIDPRVARPLLSTNEQRGLDYFTFTAAPAVDGEVWGRFHEYDRIGFRGRVALTNFTFRGQSADSFESALRYTNRFLELIGPRLLRGAQIVSADGVAMDFPAQRVYLTNGYSDTDPLAVARAIGPKTARALEPYHFTQPPTARVNGFAPLKGEHDADLRIEVAGGPFEWWKFKVPHISGEVSWQGETLDLTNVQTAFYGGAAGGSAHFDLDPEPGTDFRFSVGVTNANLQLLMADLSTNASHLEGRLSGQWVTTQANSADSRTWNGHGHAQLRDGLIWEIPIFGVLSPALDSIVPGLGSSRVSEGSAAFVITNGVVRSDTLEMRSPTMRLQYNGTADFAGRVDARVQVEPLRDAWVIGPFLRAALWPVTKLFEYKITGTLAQPKSEPVNFIPKILFMPLHPIRTLEDLFPGEPGRTNAPPPSPTPSGK